MLYCCQLYPLQPVRVLCLCVIVGSASFIVVFYLSTHSPVCIHNSSWYQGESLRGSGERQLTHMHNNLFDARQDRFYRQDRFDTFDSLTRCARHWEDCGFDDQGNGSTKLTAAQKRQMQRDARRKYTDPDRTMAQERAERIRKDEQARNRNNPLGDPYHREFGDSWFARNREIERAMDCNIEDRNCYYHALEYDPFDRRYDYDPIHDEY